MTEQEKPQLQVQGVTIPLPGPADCFITPWWHEVMDFYPSYCEAVFERGDTPWPIQPYITQVLKGLERLKIRGRTAQDWMSRLMQHYGLSWLEGWKDKYQTLSDSLRR
jgi:hypothetical protein